MTVVRVIATPVGEAHLYYDRSRSPIATVALGHGAGRGVDAPDLAALAKELPKRRISVLRIQQPWVVAGRRVAARPEQLDAATVSCLDAVRPRTPLVLGGRSAGARVACRLAKPMGAVGCLALAFPLHPPGRPNATRIRELEGAGVPTLVVQGERDSFGGPAEFPAGTSLVSVPHADHGFAVPKRAPVDLQQTLTTIVEACAEWILSQLP